MHVISLTLATLIQLVSLDERAGERVKLLELKVARGLIVTERRRDSKILRSSVEDEVGRLRVRRSHVDLAHVHSIIAAVKRDLELQVARVVLHSFSILGDKLFLSHSGLGVRGGSKARIKTDGVRGLNRHLTGFSELDEVVVALLTHLAESMKAL